MRPVSTSIVVYWFLLIVKKTHNPATPHVKQVSDMACIWYYFRSWPKRSMDGDLPSWLWNATFWQRFWLIRFKNRKATFKVPGGYNHRIIILWPILQLLRAKSSECKNKLTTHRLIWLHSALGFSPIYSTSARSQSQVLFSLIFGRASNATRNPASVSSSHLLQITRKLPHQQSCKCSVSMSCD